MAQKRIAGGDTLFTQIINKINEASAYMTSHKKSIYAVVSVILAFYYSSVTFPGPFYSDTYGRWDIAIGVLGGYPDFVSWLSVPPSLFMMIVYKVFGNMGVYTFLQSFLFIFTSLHVLHAIAPRYWVATMLLFLNPVTLVSSIFSDPAIGSMIGFNLLFLTCWSAWKQENEEWRHSVFLFAFSLFSSYLFFGYRQNAVSVLPVFILFYVYAYIRKNRHIKWMLGLCGCLLSLVLVSLTPTMMSIQPLNSASAGLVWDTLSTINRMPEEKRNQYLTYYDDISGEGETERALAVTDMNGSVNNFLWDIILYSDIGKPENSQSIRERFITFVLNEPEYYFPTKLRMMSRTMGYPVPLQTVSFQPYRHVDLLAEIKVISENKLNSFYSFYQSYLEQKTFYRTPWVWFILGAAAVFWEKREKKKFGMFAWLYAIAFFYYAAILLANQNYEFRYFLPSYQILYMMTLSFAMDLCAKLVVLGKKRFAAK